MSKQAACGVCEVATNKNPRQPVALSVCLWGRGGGRQQKAAHVASSARPSLMTLFPRGRSGPPHSASRSPVEMHSQPGGPLSVQTLHLRVSIRCESAKGSASPGPACMTGT